ncbi:MAG: hypothetical protein ACP5LH_03585 [Candidatus Micrarchaeia archaeon]
MAKRIVYMQPSSSGGMMSSGWSGAVLNTLFAVFVIAIVFGVFLIAAVITGNTLSTTAGANNVIGNTNQTPISVFQTLLSYLVTLANFVGIIILIVIIMIVIAVVYMIFRPNNGGGNGLTGV